jgi:hypothetical protein
MPPPNKKTTATAAAWLAALGLFGASTLGVAVAQDPAADVPAVAAPASEAPAAPAADPNTKPAPDGPPTVLLRTNGKVLQGEIRRDANGYVVKTKVGVMLFNRREVDRTFRSMDELYAYKASLCPEDDADERLKLATWCLEQKLKPQAKAQLAAVLELSPENRRAKAMMANLDRPDAPVAAARDDGIERASVEMPSPRPADLDLERLREAQARNPRAAGLPVIFDLGPVLAVRRYQEFAATVHPILQNRCAKCHNESTPGDFQLIQTRTRKDLSNELVLRANLEAALRIISSDDLSRSPILTASGMTHGNGGKAVLGGPASPEYRTLAAWVTSLRPTTSKGPGQAATSNSVTGQGQSEGFATGRRPSTADPARPPPSGARTAPEVRVPPGIRPEDADAYRELASSGFKPRIMPGMRSEDAEVVRPRIRPPGAILPGSEVGIPSDPPGDEEFTTNALRKPKPPARPIAKRGTVPNDDEPTEPGKLAPGTPGTITLPSGEVVPIVTKDMTEKKKDDPKKPSRIDPKKLKLLIPKPADK